MNKTDKELATDIVCAFLNNVGSVPGGIPMQADNLKALIRDVYETVSNLDK